jgi:hypothetical protein
LAAHLLGVVGHPPGAARDDFHAGGETALYIAVGYRWSRKFNGYVSRAEGGTLEILLVVDVDAADHLVAASQGYLFDHTTHFAVAD